MSLFLLYQDDITVPASAIGEEFSRDYLVKSGMSHTGSDDHIWWSVFSRPVRSRFNRKQRVSICMAMLMLTVMTCGMWYNGASPVILDPLSTIGPIPMDSRDVSNESMLNDNY